MNLQLYIQTLITSTGTNKAFTGLLEQTSGRQRQFSEIAGNPAGSAATIICDLGVHREDLRHRGPVTTPVSVIQNMPNQPRVVPPYSVVTPTLLRPYSHFKGILLRAFGRVKGVRELLNRSGTPVYLMGRFNAGWIVNPCPCFFSTDLSESSLHHLAVTNNGLVSPEELNQPLRYLYTQITRFTNHIINSFNN